MVGTEYDLGKLRVRVHDGTREEGGDWREDGPRCKVAGAGDQVGCFRDALLRGLLMVSMLAVSKARCASC